MVISRPGRRSPRSGRQVAAEELQNFQCDEQLEPFREIISNSKQVYQNTKQNLTDFCNNSAEKIKEQLNKFNQRPVCANCSRLLVNAESANRYEYTNRFKSAFVRKVNEQHKLYEMNRRGCCDEDYDYGRRGWKRCYNNDDDDDLRCRKEEKQSCCKSRKKRQEPCYSSSMQRCVENLYQPGEPDGYMCKNDFKKYRKQVRDSKHPSCFCLRDPTGKKYVGEIDSDLWKMQFDRWWGWNYGRKRGRMMKSAPCEEECIPDNRRQEFQPSYDADVNTSSCGNFQKTRTCRDFDRDGWPKAWGRPRKRSWFHRMFYFLGPRLDRPNYENCCDPMYQQPLPSHCKPIFNPMLSTRTRPSRRERNKCDRRVCQSWMRDPDDFSSCESLTEPPPKKRSSTASSIEYLSCRIQSVVDTRPDDDDDCPDCCCCCQCRMQICERCIQTEKHCACSDLGTQTETVKKKCCGCCKRQCKNCVLRCPGPCGAKVCNRRTKVCVDGQCKAGSRKPTVLRADYCEPKLEVIEEGRDGCCKRKSHCSKRPKTKIYKVSSTQCLTTEVPETTRCPSVNFSEQAQVFLAQIDQHPTFTEPVFSSPLTGRKYNLKTPEVTLDRLMMDLKTDRILDLDSEMIKNKRFNIGEPEKYAMNGSFEFDDSGFNELAGQQQLQEKMPQLCKMNTLLKKYSLNELEDLLKKIEERSENVCKVNEVVAEEDPVSMQPKLDLIKASQLVKEVLEGIEPIPQVIPLEPSTDTNGTEDSQTTIEVIQSENKNNFDYVSTSTINDLIPKLATDNLSMCSSTVDENASTSELDDDIKPLPNIEKNKKDEHYRRSKSYSKLRNVITFKKRDDTKSSKSDARCCMSIGKQRKEP